MNIPTIVMLSELNAGQYHGFRDWIAQNNIHEIAYTPIELFFCPLEHLLRALAGTQVTALKLESCSINDEIAPLIFKLLAHTAIVDLNLDDNRFTAKMAADCAAFCKYTSLQKISIWDANWEDGGVFDFVKNLAGSKVAVLDLTENDITEAGYVAIAPLIPYTQLTQIIDTNELPEVLQQALQQNYVRLTDPRVVACTLSRLPIEQYCEQRAALLSNQPWPTTHEQEMRYATGILMFLKEVPPLFERAICFLPSMNHRSFTRFELLAKQIRERAPLRMLIEPVPKENTTGKRRRHG